MPFHIEGRLDCYTTCLKTEVYVASSYEGVVRTAIVVSCRAGQPLRIGTATALVPTTVLRIQKRAMMRTLHAQSALSDRFIAHMLARNVRIEEDLVDPLFDSSEKRLARTLLLLARYGDERTPQRVLPKISQETPAEMVGTTRSRVNVFMTKFRKLGFITGKRHAEG